MTKRNRIISCELSPNATWRDVIFACWSLVNPIRWLSWKRGSAAGVLESEFAAYFDVPDVHAIAFDSGRTALKTILQSLRLSEGDEVILQPFTCVVVPNAIIAAGGKPCYVDIDETYNIDVEQLKRALEGNSVKAVIVQHTFGIPADIQKIQELCKEKGVYLIEDCAHALGATVEGKKVGTFGDAAMFSFGRDKIISSVSGGMALLQSSVDASAVRELQQTLPLPSSIWIWQHLNHPVVFAAAKKLYTRTVGKALIAITRTLRIWPLVLTNTEKNGAAPTGYRLPNILARAAIKQFKRLDEMNIKRKSAAKTYLFSFGRNANINMQRIHSNTRPVHLRFAFTVKDSSILLEKAKKNDILLGTWYRSIIDPAGSNCSAVNYSPGSCPTAERIAQSVVNLPTHTLMRKKDIKRVATFIQNNIQ